MNCHVFVLSLHLNTVLCRLVIVVDAEQIILTNRVCAILDIHRKLVLILEELIVCVRASQHILGVFELVWFNHAALQALVKFEVSFANERLIFEFISFGPHAELLQSILKLFALFFGVLG